MGYSVSLMFYLKAVGQNKREKTKSAREIVNQKKGSLQIAKHSDLYLSTLLTFFRGNGRRPTRGKKT